MFKVKDDAVDCSADSFDKSNTIALTAGHVYDTTYFDATLTTNLDLVCGKDYMNKFLGSILMVGLMIGCFIGGPLGDKFGRRVALLWVTGLLVPFIALGSLVETFIHYAFLILLINICLGISWVNW